MKRPPTRLLQVYLIDRRHVAQTYSALQGIGKGLLMTINAEGRHRDQLLEASPHSDPFLLSSRVLRPWRKGEVR